MPPDLGGVYDLHRLPGGHVRPTAQGLGQSADMQFHSLTLSLVQAVSPLVGLAAWETEVFPARRLDALCAHLPRRPESGYLLSDLLPLAFSLNLSLPGSGGSGGSGAPPVGSIPLSALIPVSGAVHMVFHRRIAAPWHNAESRCLPPDPVGTDCLVALLQVLGALRSPRSGRLIAPGAQSRITAFLL